MTIVFNLFVDDYGAATVKLTFGLFIPFRDAAILVVPAATPVAKPRESIVAIDGISLTQVT